MNIAVLGAKGRMGSQACQAISDAPDLHLVAAIDLDGSLNELITSKAEVILDFTSPAAVMGNLEFAITHGIHAVVGTTGFDNERLSRIKTLLSSNPKVGVLIAPNFGLGAVLMMNFAQQAAKYFESVEIIELHHPEKLDAPSGTASRTAELISQVRAELPPNPDGTQRELPGARGANVQGIPIHSVRLRGLVAHQEILFGDQGETLSIRHDSYDRSGFMPGVLLGLRQVQKHPGLTLGLENYMNLI
jgi:4-hydroxy-tetrahydrodipicolinate reductase